MRRFVILATVFVAVTVALRFGPTFYPWTPAAERASRHEAFTDPDELSPIRQAYREATDLYRQGRFDEAEERFRKAAQGSSALLQARSAFYQGNCLLGRVRRERNRTDQDLLTKAAEHYRDCLAQEGRVTGGDALFQNARVNLEMTHRLLAQSEEKGGNRASVAKGSGRQPAPTLAKGGSPGERAKPALAGTVSPAQPENQSTSSSQMASSAKTEREPEGVMVGPDGVVYRKVAPDAATKE